jgi:hypothetical protein
MQIDAPKPAFWPKRIGLRDDEVERIGRCVGVTANARGKIAGRNGGR